MLLQKKSQEKSLDKLQKIVIDQLENKDQPFLHRLAADEKYFEEVSKYVEENLGMSLEKFINSIYKSSSGDIHFRNNSNETALYPASENLNYSMIHILKSCGADINDFKKEINNKISEELEKLMQISLRNIDNVSNITETARNVTSIRNAFMHLDSTCNIKAFIAGCIGSFALAIITNTINGNYYDGAYIPVVHYSSNNFIIDRINAFIGFVAGVVTYETAQKVSELVRNISDLWHNKLESKKNESQLTRYQKIQTNIIVIEAVEPIFARYAVEK